MKNTSILLLNIFFLISIAFVEDIKAQHYIKKSFMIGGSSDELEPTQVMDNDGNIHLLFLTSSSDIQLPPGSPSIKGFYNGGFNGFFYVKYNAEGNILVSRYIGGTSQEYNPSIAVDANGIAHIVGRSNSTNYPVVHGEGPHGNYDIVYTKIDQTGEIIFSTHIGGSSDESITMAKPLVFGDNGDVGIAFSTQSSDIMPGFVDRPFFGGHNDVFFMILDNNGIPKYASYYGSPTSYEYMDDFEYGPDGNYYLSGTTGSNNFPITVGNSYWLTNFILKFNPIGDLVYAMTIGDNNGFEINNKIEVTPNGTVFLLSHSDGDLFPVTDFSDTYDSWFNLTFSRIGPNGDVQVAKYLTHAENKPSSFILDKNEQLHLLTTVNSFYPEEVIVTNGSTPQGKEDYLYQKVDRDGNVLFGTYIGGNDDEVLEEGENFATIKLIPNTNEIRLFGSTESTNYPISKYGYPKIFPLGKRESVYSVFNHVTGEMKYSTHLGAFANKDIYYQYGFSSSIEIGNNGNSYLASLDNNASKAKLTVNQAAYGKADISVFILEDVYDLIFTGSKSFAKKNAFAQPCNTNYEIPVDTLSPSNLQVCEGTTQLIVGKPIYISSDKFPVIYINGIPNPQPQINAEYNWQITTDTNSVPWTTLNGVFDKDLSYPLGSTKVFIRRLAIAANCTSADTVLSISNISVLDPVLSAPTADAGLDITSCPGSVVSIGGSLSSGGTSPYTYSWDNGAAPGLPTNVAPLTSTTYELTVEDANGCFAKDKVKVSAYQADAGPDVSACLNDSVRIGTIGGVGFTGITYNWSPTPDLSNPNAIQPFAKYNAASTNYTLTVNYPQTAGSNCVSNDVVNVLSVLPPSPINFAGPDTIVVYGNSIDIGTSPPSTGYQYIWSPAGYLDHNSMSLVEFRTNLFDFSPNQNPLKYFLTASNLSCSFVDELNISVIHADAGPDKCGPATIGGNSDAPGLAETFLWEKITLGPGTNNFIGPTNTPVTTVSAGTNSTTYRLTTSLNGISTSDEVTIAPCSPSGGGGGGSPPPPGVCFVGINAVAPYECASTLHGDVVLNASNMLHPENEYTYQWSVVGGGDLGLSSDNLQYANVITTDPKLYQVTITNIIDTNFTCVSDTFAVNQAYMQLPIFEATDMVLCIGDTAEIQSIFAAGYLYEWSPATGLSSTTVSNPLVTASLDSITYQVKVTDSIAGCSITDTVIVLSINKEISANAGFDSTVCVGSTLTIGNNVLNPNYTYNWSSPQGPINFASGDSTSPNPSVTVNSSQTFIIDVTDNTVSCTDSDTVTISTVTQTPSINLTDAYICDTNTSVQIGVVPEKFVTYNWSPSTNLSNQNISNPIASPTDTTVYVLTSTMQGCLPAIDSLTVFVVNSNFDRTIEFCPSDTSSPFLGDSVPIGFFSYSWSPENAVSDPNIRNPQLATELINQPLTLINLVSEITPGCIVRSLISVKSSIAPIFNVGYANMCLNENNLALGSELNPVDSNFIYSWSPSTNLDDASSHNPIFTPPSTGVYNYTVSKTDIGASCTSQSTMSINVTDYQLPADTTINVCENAQLNIGIPIEPFVLFEWLPNRTILSTNGPTAVIAPINDTVYTLIATNIFGCTYEMNFNIDVITGVQTPTISLPSVIEVEPFSDTVLSPIISPTDTGSYNYIWSTDNGIIQSNIYIVNPTVSVLQPGNYNFFLELTNEEGCFFGSSTLLQAKAIEADLSLRLNVDNSTPNVGETITFSVNVLNSGPNTATGISVESQLPSPGYNLTLVNNGGLNTGNNIAQWSGISLAVGQDTTLTFNAIVNTPTGVFNMSQFDGEYTAFAQVTASNLPDPNSSPNNFNGCNVTENDEDCAAVAVILPSLPPPVNNIIDLELQKSVSNSTPKINDQIQFTIEVTNRGPLKATGVSVIDLLPAEFLYISNSGNGTYIPNSGIWNIGDIEVDEVFTLIIVVEVLTSNNILYSNTAEVLTANEDDIDSSPNNHIEGEDDQETITISPIFEIEIPEGFSPNDDTLNDVFEIEIPEGFSPNDDALNDVFEIRNLEVTFPNFRIRIYNRFGKKMYDYKHNGNPQEVPIWWNGSYKDEIAPTGTYFYILNFNNGQNQSKNGTIYLNK